MVCDHGPSLLRPACSMASCHTCLQLWTEGHTPEGSIQACCWASLLWGSAAVLRMEDTGKASWVPCPCQQG